MTHGRGVLVALGVAVAVLAVAGGARGEPPGDAARGRETFTAKACARCHVPRSQAGVGPALEQLRRPQGAFVLAGRLWNHAPGMFTILKIENLQWPQISAAEMADLKTYLEADPARDPAPDLSAQRAAYESAVAWAARMWRHTPAMAAKAMEIGVLYPRFAEDEMLNLVAFLRSSAR